MSKKTGAVSKSQSKNSKSSSSLSSISSSSSHYSSCSSFGLDSMDQSEVRKVFSRFDANGDGKISATELTEILRALGSEAHPDEVQNMMNEMDTDHDGFVDFDEFVAFHLNTHDQASDEAELKEAFAMYDLDKNGVISAKELHQVLRRLGERCSVGDCAKMIRSVDVDGDGCVSFEEFKKMMGASDKSGSK
ncbi:Calcium-binding EF-hand family protein [Rhynchospora pubera]|uniref:Calcium-binding EF-hand family protein n=1 Tax=Rhynchospora pubera TaxID=906938 RepID=A0AAV8F5M4_9POAL|nr:Calcium-binding EF-hand family protein [Rhynchospora pubera]